MVCQKLEFTENEDSILRTARLVLRRPRAEDTVGIARFAADREIAENTERLPLYLTGAPLNGSGSAIGAWEGFAAFTHAGGQSVLVGAGSLHSSEEGSWTLGFWIGQPYRGRGLATEMARAIIDYGFEGLDAQKIAVACRVTNAAARSVIEKCGFQWRNCGLSNAIGVRGSFPVDRFRLERRVWASLKSWMPAHRQGWPAEPVSVKAGMESVTR